MRSLEVILAAMLIGFAGGALCCWLAFRMGIRVVLRLQHRIDDNYTDPFKEPVVARVEQEFTE